MALGDGIRRNIAHVDPSERALFRDALIELNNRVFPGARTDTLPGGVTWWFKQDEIHQATHVHSFSPGDNPEFVPWHRELMNRMEAMLREINPQLSLHYWDWTQDPRSIPNANLGGGNTGQLDLFTADFMGYGGTTSAPIGEPWLSAGYYVPGASPHRDSSNNPADPPQTVTRFINNSIGPASPAQDDGIIGAPDYAAMTAALESVHNSMHGFVAMGGAHVSFRDPFVFLLHSNVDRLFAMWQTASGHSERLDGNTIYTSGGVTPAEMDHELEPWNGSPPTTRPWAPPENQGVAKTYKHPSVVKPPCYDTLPISVMLKAPVSGAPITFNAVPESVTTVRAAVFDIQACSDVTLEIIGGTVKPLDPTAPFDTPLGLTRVVAYNHQWPYEGRVWISFTGTTDGSMNSGSVTIRCPETAEQWTIPITAQTIAKPKAAGILVLDKSGSMAWDSGIPSLRRLDVLKWAAPHYVNLMDDDDGIGIVAFDHDAYPVMGVTTAGPPVFGAGRANALAGISAHDEDNGGTAIGDGLELGHNTINPVTGFDHKALVVFTDGHETASKRIADVSGLLNESVYAIGLGRADQLDVGTLDNLTSGTGGFLLMTGDLGVDDLFRVSKYFLQVLAGVTNTEIIVDPEAAIAPGQTHRIPFQLNEADYRTDVVLLCPAPWALDIALETPDGTLVTEADAAALPQATFVNGTGVSFYRFSLPLLLDGNRQHGGTWYTVVRTDASTFKEYMSVSARTKNFWFRGGVPYSMSVYARSTTSMRPLVTQNSHEPGATVRARVLLSQYDLPVSSGAVVRVEVARPDATSGLLTLSQNEPGIYQGEFTAAVPGIYTLRFRATGTTLGGFPFTREALRTAGVTPGGDKPSTVPTDEPWERICELVECLLSNDGLRKVIGNLGVSEEDLLRCIHRMCDRRPEARPQPATVTSAVLADDLTRLLNRVDIRSVLATGSER